MHNQENQEKNLDIGTGKEKKNLRKYFERMSRNKRGLKSIDRKCI